MKRLFAIIAAASLAVMAVAPIALASDMPPTTGVVRVGDYAPAFKLTTEDGKEVCVGKECRGNIKVLMFWSFFCFPCQAEMPDIDEFHHEMIDKGVEVIGIGLDGHEYDNLIIPFVAKHNLTFPMVYDTPTEDFFETAEKYGVVGTPTFFIVDGKGKVRFIQLGKMNVKTLSGLVESAKSQAYCSDLITPGTKKKKAEELETSK